MKMPSPQLDMFAPPAPERRIGGGPPDVQDRMALAFTEPVKLELLATAAAQPGRWLGWNDFAAVRDKHKIGFCMGHVLSSLVRDGRMREMICWHGAERPGLDTEYRGFGSRWRAIL
jgi:hypothetical protein